MTVVIAVDMSAVSSRAVEAVRRLFPHEGLRVVLVHVAEPDPAFVGWEGGPEVVRDQMADIYRHARREVEAMATSLRDDGIDAVGVTIQGVVVDTILSEAARADANLIVVGSQGHGAAFDLFAGSVSSGLIRKAAVPVLVVPHQR